MPTAWISEDAQDCHSPRAAAVGIEMAVPTDDHSEEFEELAALSALDALDGIDLVRFDRHRARCGLCRTIERRDREILATLALAPPEMDASAGFKARLMRRAELEYAASADLEHPQSAVRPIQPMRVQLGF